MPQLAKGGKWIYIVVVPPEVGVQPGDRLLVVRGSVRALGFVVRGPIYAEAEKHTGLRAFEFSSSR